MINAGKAGERGGEKSQHGQLWCGNGGGGGSGVSRQRGQPVPRARGRTTCCADGKTGGQGGWSTVNGGNNVRPVKWGIQTQVWLTPAHSTVPKQQCARGLHRDAFRRPGWPPFQAPPLSLSCLHIKKKKKSANSDDSQRSFGENPIR